MSEDAPILGRLSDWLGRRKWLVLGIWGALLLAAAPFAMRQTEDLTGGGQSVPGSDSIIVDEASTDFPGQRTNQMAVVVDDVDNARERTRAQERLKEAVGKVEDAKLGDRTPQQRAQQRDGGPLLYPLITPAKFSDGMAVAEDLRKELNVGDRDTSGGRFYLVGSPPLWTGLSDASKEDLIEAEVIGFPIVFIILLAVFGSFAAAVLPLGLGAVSVTLTGACIWLLSQSYEVSIFTTNVASLIGIGVAIDYSLFILARYRQARAAGGSHEAARATALRTSGSAVVFSGITVMVALSGLFLINTTILRSMAAGGIIVVAISVLVAITLLPALITLMGRRLEEPGRFVSRARRPFVRGGADDAAHEGSDWWGRWTTAVMRRPGRSALISALIMLAVGAPLLVIDTGTGALVQIPKDHDVRKGLRLAADRAGPGVGSEVKVLVRFDEGDARSPRNQRLLEQFRRRLDSQRAVSAVPRPAISRNGRSALLTAIPRAHFENPRVIALTDRLRLRPESIAPDRLMRRADVFVGGGAAQNLDFKDVTDQNLWKVLLWAVVLTFLVLMLLLRSVLLPLKAVVMNLLTVAAAYGALVMVFDWGWLDWTPFFDSYGYVNSFSLPYVLAVVFGLSMDYEVFLLSRVRERYLETGDNKVAVADALRASAGTITSAALIMVAVFLIFAFVSVPSVQEIGVGLAVAIALDATLVRLVLVPASMQLMGRWNWWVPAWLDRILPGRSSPAAVPAPAAVAGARSIADDGLAPAPPALGLSPAGLRFGAATGAAPNGERIVEPAGLHFGAASVSEDPLHEPVRNGNGAGREQEPHSS